MAGGRYIFSSDMHLGADCPRDTEAEFIAFLDALPSDTRALYLLGDVFDFWFEKRSRRCGFENALEALRRAVGRGVEVYFLKGNHDWWTFGELELLSGVKMLQPQPVELSIAGKHFCLAHGDGLGKDSFKERLTQAFLKGRMTIFLARWLTPTRWLDALARRWASSSRRHNDAHPYVFTTESPLWKFTCEREKEHPADFFIYGHIHSPITMSTPQGAGMYILSDWSAGPSWLEYDGEKMLRRGAGSEEGAGGGEGGEGGEGANEDGALHTDNQHITESASPDGEGKDFAQTADYKEDTLHTKKSRAGFSVPLAGVRSRSSLGCGDLGCLKLLVDLACELGEGTVHALQVVDSVAGRAGTPIYPVLADIRSLESVSPAGKQAGYLASAAELEGEDTIDFAKVYNAKMHYLNERFQQEGGQVLSSDAYHSFWRANRHWLEQYSAYCVLRHKYGTGDSRYWSEPDYERLLEDDSFIREYSADMRFHLYVQFILHNQLQEALAYAAARGIAIEFSARQEALPQTMRQWWAGLGQEERQSWCKDKLGLDIQPPQQLEGWLAESVLEERLKDKPGAKDIPLEDLLGITRILPWPAAEAGPQANVRMPVRLEDILQHKALLEQIRKVADSSIRKF